MSRRCKAMSASFSVYSATESSVFNGSDSGSSSAGGGEGRGGEGGRGGVYENFRKELDNQAWVSYFVLALFFFKIKLLKIDVCCHSNHPTTLSSDTSGSGLHGGGWLRRERRAEQRHTQQCISVGRSDWLRTRHGQESRSAGCEELLGSQEKQEGGTCNTAQMETLLGLSERCCIHCHFFMLKIVWKTITRVEVESRKQNDQNLYFEHNGAAIMSQSDKHLNLTPTHLISHSLSVLLDCNLISFNTVHALGCHLYGPLSPSSVWPLVPSPLASSQFNFTAASVSNPIWSL